MERGARSRNAFTRLRCPRCGAPSAQRRPRSCVVSTWPATSRPTGRSWSVEMIRRSRQVTVCVQCPWQPPWSICSIRRLLMVPGTQVPPLKSRNKKIHSRHDLIMRG